MKKAIILTLTVLFGAAIVFTGCKYEEGPKLSMMSKKGRLAGTWTVEKATSTTGSSSVDVTSFFAGYSLTIEKDGKYTATWGSFSSSGTWVWGDGKESVITTDGNTGDKDTMNLTRLKNKEMWTKEVSGNQTDEIHYKQ